MGRWGYGTSIIEVVLNKIGNNKSGTIIKVVKNYFLLSCTISLFDGENSWCVTVCDLHNFFRENCPDENEGNSLRKFPGEHVTEIRNPLNVSCVFHARLCPPPPNYCLVPTPPRLCMRHHRCYGLINSQRKKRLRFNEKAA